ncbi:hypothetical protein FYJ92_18485 [Pseudarthrobacter sp. NBSH8]|nr:hypothetical protein FYJ92_18485 [Pseudarthrobacter sp. NBSH8]
MGLGLISLSAPAMAAADKVIVCHDGAQTGTGWSAIQFSVNGLNGHDGHPADIIPPNSSIPGGLNWTNAGKITYIANCAPLPPGEEPPVYPPVDPPAVVVVPPVVVVDPPAVVVDPPAVVVDPPAVVVDPPAVVVDPPALVETPVAESAVVVQTPVTSLTPASQTPAAGATAASQGTNQGFNAQTAVGGAVNAPAWLVGLGMMLGAGALVAVRRRSLEPKAD